MYSLVHITLYSGKWAAKTWRGHLHLMLITCTKSHCNSSTGEFQGTHVCWSQLAKRATVRLLVDYTGYTKPEEVDCSTQYFLDTNQPTNQPTIWRLLHTFYLFHLQGYKHRLKQTYTLLLEIRRNFEGQQFCVNAS